MSYGNKSSSVDAENEVFCPCFHGDNQTAINEQETALGSAEFGWFEITVLQIIPRGPLLVSCDAFQESQGDF